MTELIGSSGFSRRNFIKGAAVFGTAGVLAGCKLNWHATLDSDCRILSETQLAQRR